MSSVANIANGSDFPVESLESGRRAQQQAADDDETAARTTRSSSIDSSASDDSPKVNDWKVLGLLWTMAMLHGFAKNIAHANTMGLSADLGITLSQYSFMLMIFFPGFLISTLAFVFWLRPAPRFILRILTLSTLIMAIATGLNTVAMYLPDKTAWILISVTRFVQGLCEGTYAALQATYMLLFYSPSQMAKRMPLFFLVPALSTGLGGLYAFAIVFHDKHYLRNWQWVFLLQAVVAAPIAILSQIFLPAAPPDAGKRGIKEQTLSLAKVKAAVTNPACFFWVATMVCLSLPMQLVLLWLPSVVARFDFSVEIVNLGTAVPYLFAAAALMVMIAGHRVVRRTRQILIIFVLQLFGFVVYRVALLWTTPAAKAIGYTATVFMALGVGTTNVLAAQTYGPMIDANEQRLLVNALGVSAIQFGGIIMAWVYNAENLNGNLWTIVFLAVGCAVAIGGDIHTARRDREQVPAAKQSNRTDLEK